MGFVIIFVLLILTNLYLKNRKRYLEKQRDNYLNLMGRTIWLSAKEAKETFDLSVLEDMVKDK